MLEWINQGRRLDAVPPRRLNPGIPCDRQTACLKCLQKDQVKAYPQEPDAYLALSLAYAQVYKNAYVAKDDALSSPT